MEIEKIKTNKSIESSLVTKAKQAKADSEPNRGFEQHALTVGLYQNYLTRVSEGLEDYRLGQVKATPIVAHETQRIVGLERSDAEPNLRQFGELLADYRGRIGITRGGLARIVSMDASHIFRLEHGERNIGPRSLDPFIQALELNEQEADGFITAAGFKTRGYEIVTRRLRIPKPPKQEVTKSIKTSIWEKIDLDQKTRLFRQELYARRLLEDYRTWVGVGLTDLSES